MARSSLVVLLVSIGTVVAMRTSTGTHADTDDGKQGHTTRATAATNGTSHFNTTMKLLRNQYILDWFDPFGSEPIAKEIKTHKWQFVVPVLCRKRGLWLKVNTLMKKRAGHHCISVICHVDGSITVEALQECPYMEIYHRSEHNTPERLLDTNHANVVSRNMVFGNPMGGLPPATGSRGMIMSLNALTETDLGWEFINVAQLTLHRSQFVAWPGPELFCREAINAWEEYDLAPEDEGALSACLRRAEEERQKCQGVWSQRMGVQTAWVWKELGHPTGEGVELVFPGCTAWCKKAKCDTTDPPEVVQRDKAKMMSIFNSNKYKCEQELDEYAKKAVHKCMKEGGFCYEPWEELEPCAEFLALPQEPEDPLSTRT